MTGRPDPTRAVAVARDLAQCNADLLAIPEGALAGLRAEAAGGHSWIFTFSARTAELLDERWVTDPVTPILPDPRCP